jgi:predicted small secreted protein
MKEKKLNSPHRFMISTIIPRLAASHTRLRVLGILLATKKQMIQNLTNTEGRAQFSQANIVALLFLTALLAIVGIGCNTAHGFGKDVEKAGEKIQEKTK